MKFRLLMIILLLFPMFIPLAASGPEDITYITEDYPPENYLENGELKGYAVEILKEVWREMGVAEQPIQVMPWARGYATALNQPDIMLFAMARNSEREKLFKWVGPIYYTRIKLFSLRNADYNIKTIDDAKELRTGVMRNDIGDRILIEKDFPETSLTRVRELKQLIMMLKTGRIDLICTTETSLKNEIARHKELNISYKTVLLLEEIQVYYAFSSQTDDMTVSRFQKALTGIDKKRRSIVRKYIMSE